MVMRGREYYANGSGPLTQLTARVSAMSGYTEASLLGPGRERDLCWSRFGLMYAMKEGAGCSLSEIGRFMNRDHTTVIHGIKRAKLLRETDDIFREFSNEAAVYFGPRPATPEDLGISNPQPFYETLFLRGNHA